MLALPDLCNRKAQSARLAHSGGARAAAGAHHVGSPSSKSGSDVRAGTAKDRLVVGEVRGVVG